jgi:phage/plasmid-associated DNA primase
MAELILKNEASGILNWLLEGRSKLAKEKLQLTQTGEQKSRTINLLLGSDSPAAFVRSCLLKKKDGELGILDLYARYQEWSAGSANSTEVRLRRAASLLTLRGWSRSCWVVLMSPRKNFSSARTPALIPTCVQTRL